MTHIRQIFITVLFLSAISIQAQQSIVRYVDPRPSASGAHEASYYDGTSWDKAMPNLQDAINMVRSSMEFAGYYTAEGALKAGYEPGMVYVAGTNCTRNTDVPTTSPYYNTFFNPDGTYHGGIIYTPTESTERDKDGVLFTAFKMYPGVNVYGGYHGIVTDEGGNVILAGETGDELKPENRVRDWQWNYKYKTILSGNHGGRATTFTWNSIKNMYDAVYPGNSYHVVWFATSGFGVGPNKRAKSLPSESILNGCIIQDGRAGNHDLASTDYSQCHTAYGGGAYMVENAVISNCVFLHNGAVRAGGAAYMDGGGLIDHCMIQKGQAEGNGVGSGLGGGVCLADDGMVRHSFIANCYANMGGGIAITHEENYQHYHGQDNAGEQDTEYSEALVVSSLVTNNNAGTEAGGIYMHHGGILNQVTVTKNRMTGPSTIIGGVAYGRSAGVYVDRNARILNTVMWGGFVRTLESEASHDDLQFAANTIHSTDELRPDVQYSALSFNEITDWNGCVRTSVQSLSSTNMGDDVSGATLYPNFIHVPLQLKEGVTSDFDNDANYEPYVGVCRTTMKLNHSLKGYTDEKGEDVDNNNFHYGTEQVLEVHATKHYGDGILFPNHASALRASGVRVEDLTNDPLMLRAMVDVDAKDQTFMARTTIGAIRAVEVEATPVLVNSVETAEGYTEENEGQLPTLFVDPNYHGVPDDAHVGQSWATPLTNINDALAYMDSYLKAHPGYKRGQVLVKQGTLDISGQVSIGNRLRECFVLITSNTRVYGGYPSTNTGISIENRSPRKYETHLTGNLIGYTTNETYNYDYNATHVVSMSGADNATLDGFHIMYGNATWINPEGTGDMPRYRIANSRGGGFIASDEQASLPFVQEILNDPERLTRVRHNVVRNCVFANNTATNGSAIYVNARYHKVKFDFINCAFRNNTATVPEAYPEGPKDYYDSEQQTYQGYNGTETGYDSPCTVFLSSQYAPGNEVQSLIDATFDHCNFVKNVGYAIGISGLPGTTIHTTASTGFSEDSPQLLALQKNDNISVKITNSILWANTISPKEDSEVLANYASDGKDVRTWYARGIARDAVRRQNGEFGAIYGIDNISSPQAQAVMLDRWMNGYQDTEAHTAFTGYAILTYKDEASNGIYTFPIFQNPTKNIGAAHGKQNTQYGGSCSYMPRNMNPIVNAAINSKQAYDYGRVPRTYGGAADIGYIENTEQPLNGTVYYVRDYAATGTNQPTYDMAGGNVTENASGMGIYNQFGQMLDGSTWARAVNGNATYPDGKVGLQHAVDEASTAWTSGDNKQVWVGAGLYQHDNTTKNKDGDNSCFMIRDHVNVYGAFPKAGNPSTTERHPLLSQYIYKPDNITARIEDYETILEPVTKTVTKNSANRVLGQPYANNPHKSGYTDYKGCEWDGFTLRHGVLDVKMINDNVGNGGAGLAIYKNVIARNMVITENTEFFDGEFRGGAVYIGGGTAVNLYIINNEMCGWNYSTDERYAGNKNIVGYGGGAYLRHNCTMYNCLVYGNKIKCYYSDGAGLFLDGTATFFNNTIVSNEATGTASYIGGLATWTSGASTQLNLYNCIIHSNKGKNSASIGTKDIGIRSSGVINVINSLVEAGDNVGSGNKKIVYASSVQRETDATKIFDKVVAGNFLQSNYRLKADISNKAINKGEDSPVVDGITYDLSGYTDMDYADRIQDCRIDIGAYEFNGAYLITPEETIEDGKKVVYFYVTQNGRGLSSGNNPENAACWQKLQKILDAAGRYLYDHPETKVIVKIAGDNKISGTQEWSGFKYLPTRNAGVNELEQENPRFYSYMIPHGVELWGGYSDAYKSATDHGFLEENRSITGHPSYIRGWHHEAGEDVDSYHCLTFTNTVYDEEGRAIEGKTLTDKAEIGLTIVDGIFITGGKATGETEDTQRGGAAIVPDYAIIRNCIIEDNEASLQGGALYLLKGSKVLGCLIKKNTAGIEGGGVAIEDYVYNDGSTTNPDLANDYPMLPRLIGCTVVLNTAKRGGGLSFHTQTRTYATVLWQNEANEYDNVYGVFEPQKTVSPENTFDQYPMSYCAVENVRVAGLDNISVSSRNDEGVRFKTDEATLTKNGTERINYSGSDYQDVDTYFGLEEYSVLVRTGVPTYMYYQYKPIFLYRAEDFMDVPRVYVDDVTGEEVDFIDIGARAVGKFMRVRPVEGMIMTRLFVVPAADVEYGTVKKLQLLSSSDDLSEKIYSQQGSTFAYPMQQLDDALMYIREARMIKAKADGTDPQGNVYHTGEYAYRNTTFEVFISGGSFYPMRNIRGEHSQSSSSTFLIPEGVHVFGGLNNDDMNGSRLYRYCQETSGTKTVGTGANVVELDPMTTVAIRLYHRRLYDLNANSIIEPWEHENQTILNGEVVNDLSASEKTNSYHVVTIIPAEEYVGGLPDKDLMVPSAAGGDGIKPHQGGKTVVLDGLMIQNGRAHSQSSEAANPYDIYKGAGIYVNGSWMSEGDGTLAHPYNDVFKDNADEDVKDNHDSNKMGYRNIPVVLRSCKFMGNEAGEGAAIWSNGQLEIYSCSFEANKAISGSETVVDNSRASVPLKFDGKGGVVFSSNLLTAVNTLFANNEAEIGGVVYVGGNGSSMLMNCDLVRNKATEYPCLYYDIPNFKADVVPAHLQPWRWRPQMNLNTVFWGNEAQSNNKVANLWTSASAVEEQMWFCAYEEGVGSDPVYDSNQEEWKNYRKVPFVQATDMTIGKMFSNHKFVAPGDDRTKDQYGEADVNMNVIIASTNDTDDGPNFGNPSITAGVSGYTPSADWMPARQNNLTDNGWTYVSQKVTYNSTTKDYDCHINTYGEPGFDPVPGENRNTGNVVGDGAYWAMAYSNYMPEKLVILGEVPYMQLAKDYPGLDQTTWLLRVSKDPNPSQNQTYIDIGVYEYQHVQLKPSTYGETDILWVSTKEKPDNGVADGSSWQKPTSDVQRAIETLMASRNDHHKAIHFVEGDYTPVYTVSGNLGFLINTTHLNNAVSVPDDGQHGVLSMSFRGGFSADVESQNDPATWIRNWEEYPSVIRSSERAGILPSVLGHTFYIADAHNIKSQQNNDGTFTHKSKYDVDKKDGSGTEKKSEIIPITFDGLQISNSRSSATEGGAAIYYADQYKWNENGTRDGEEFAERTEVLNTSSTDPTKLYPAKLTIKNCVFFANGARTDQGSQGVAVSIGRGGVKGDGTYSSHFAYGVDDFGSPLIYNCLFHSNAGKSIDAYDTRVVNCTFALNGGGIELKNEQIGNKWSSLYTSMLWRNGTTEYSIPAGNFVQQNLIYNIEDDATNGNFWLSNTNRDVADGPNFRNPNETFRLGITSAASKADVDIMQARDFHLMPGMKTLSVTNRVPRAQIYFEQVSTDVNNNLKSADGLNPAFWNPSWTMDPTHAPDILFNDYDLSGPMNKDNITNGYSRYRGKAIEYGAYEYKGDLQRVVYVNPSYNTNLGTGLTWNAAMEHGRLQEAINLGAVYANNNPGYDAFVFCKAATNTYNVVLPLDESIMMRPGVEVYGSISSEFIDEVTGFTPDDISAAYATEHSTRLIENYVELMRQRRPGMAEPTTKRTVISGIDGSNTLDKPSLVDGFDVRPETTVIDGQTVNVPITSPAVTLGPGNIGSQQLPIAIRNCIIHDFTATEGNVMEVRNGLLYDVLLRDNTLAPGNTTGYNAKVDRFGWILNCTLDGADNNRIMAYGAGSNATHLLNTLYGTRQQTVFSGATAPEASASGMTGKQPYAPYFTDGNYSRYALEDRQNLSYQLLETSEAINGTATTLASVSATNGAPSALDASLRRYVNFAKDLDLLGNPRVLDNKLDYGCYETWATLSDGLRINNDRDDDKYIPASYGGNMYPHEGSVMYVSKPVIVESVPFSKYDHNELLPRILPGYFLLQDGTDADGNASGWYGTAQESSLYTGKGITELRLAYAAVERNLRQKDNLISLPFDYNYTRVPNATTFWYDGEARARWNYRFVAPSADGSESPCWRSATGTIPANQGVYLNLGYEVEDEGTPVRFTALTNITNEYIYTEKDGKTVDLYQYDAGKQTDITPSGNPHFTSKENMGWNLIGQPFMVSRYYTEENAEDEHYWTDEYLAAQPYQMHKPHEMILFEDEPAEGHGVYAAAYNSWDAQSNVPSATAFFTQTAVTEWNSDSDDAIVETLHFGLPKLKVGQSLAQTRSALSEFWSASTPETPEEDKETADAPFLTKILVTDGVLRYTLPRGVTSINIYSADGILQEADVTTDVHMEITNGIYLISVNNHSTQK